MDYELVIRSIEAIDEMSLSKKRRTLMKALVAEKQNSIFITRYLESDIASEIDTCESKLYEHRDNIRSNRGIPEKLAFRLIHLGYRIINLQSTPMIPPGERSRIEALIKQYSLLMADMLDSEAGGEDDLEESFSPGGKRAESTFREDLIGQKRRPLNSPRFGRSQYKQAREDDESDFVDSGLEMALGKLRNLRMGFEKQLGQAQNRREPNPSRSERKSTNPFLTESEQRLIQSGAIPKQKDHKASKSRVDHRDHFQPVYPTQVVNDKTNFPSSVKDPVNSNDQLLNRLNNTNPFTTVPTNSNDSVSNSQMHPEIMTFTDPRLVPNPTYFVKKLPVSNWKMRYAGDDQGMQLNDFLWEVHHQAMAEQTTEQELLRSAYH